MRMPPITQPTNRHAPTGGVQSPSPRFIIIMIPNWIGSMPMDCATGRKIGVQIRISAAMSMIMPSASRMTLSISRMTIGFSEMPSSRPVSPSGTR